MRTTPAIPRNGKGFRAQYNTREYVTETHRSPPLLSRACAPTCRCAGVLCRFPTRRESMRYTLVTTAAVCLGLVAGVSAASAQEVTEAACRSMDAQVQTALEGNTQAANHDQALQERNSARQYCAHGYYKMGTTHF